MGVEVEAFVAEIAGGLPPVAGVPLGDALVKSLTASDPAASPPNASQDSAPASPIEPQAPDGAVVATAGDVTRGPSPAAGGTMENTPIGAVFRPA